MTFFKSDARTLDYNTFKVQNERALLVTNPPYGRRLSSEQEVRDLYRALGERLRHAGGWHVTLLTPEPDQLDLPLTSSLKFRNGGLLVSLVQGRVK